MAESRAGFCSVSDRVRITGELRRSGCVFAEEEAGLIIDAASCRQAMFAMVQQRVSGVPLEHVVGSARFSGLRIAVSRGVFVPRRRTEWLVHKAVSLLNARDTVVDVCCGSGAIGAAIMQEFGGDLLLHSVDIDPVAVACTERNLARFAGAQVFEGDLFDPLPDVLRGRVDLVVANAPYVPTAEIAFMPREARDHEPLTALDGGPDGLDVHRRLVSAAAGWLSPDGHLLIEVSTAQSEQAVELFVRAGLSARVETSDELDATLVAGARVS